MSVFNYSCQKNLDMVQGLEKLWKGNPGNRIFLSSFTTNYDVDIF